MFVKPSQPASAVKRAGNSSQVNMKTHPAPVEAPFTAPLTEGVELRLPSRPKPPTPSSSDESSSSAGEELLSADESSSSKNEMAPKRKPAGAKAAPVAKRRKTTSTTSKATKAKSSEVTITAKGRKPASKVTKPTTKKAPVTKPRLTKVKATESGSDEAATVAPAVKKGRTKKSLPEINATPTQRLHVFVCGQGDNAELGLGTEKGSTGVKRPRLNKFLPADTVGVVQLAAGGMHAAALTHDSKIFTWGVNDQGALGRNTDWEGGVRDKDEEESDEDSDAGPGLNPFESTPTAIPDDLFPEGTKFVKVAAGDNATFAVTTTGEVYGWGTFRNIQGVLGFDQTKMEQTTPTLVPGLKKIKDLVCGNNHVLALDSDGNVYAWGAGQANQLGRRVVERTSRGALTPRTIGLPKKQIIKIAAGTEHAFAVHKNGTVYAWGSNNYGQCGINEDIGEDNAVIPKPTAVKSLEGLTMRMLDGGNHHSIGLTQEGDCLVWGRADGGQMGIDMKDVPEEDVVLSESTGHPTILKVPTEILDEMCRWVAAGTDHNVAITTEGQAYTWGFGTSYQTGLGTDEDTEIAELVDNTAVRGKNLTWAGAGGQYTIFACPAPATE